MSDRIIRDELLESERWLDLSDVGTRLAFVILMLKADDLGNYGAGLARLARLFGPAIDGCTTERADKILTALADVDLVRRYEVDEKPYLNIPRFKQRVRYIKKVFPPSPWTTPEHAEEHRKQLAALRKSYPQRSDHGPTAVRLQSDSESVDNFPTNELNHDVAEKKTDSGPTQDGQKTDTSQTVVGTREVKRSEEKRSTVELCVAELSTGRRSSRPFEKEEFKSRSIGQAAIFASAQTLGMQPGPTELFTEFEQRVRTAVAERGTPPNA